LPPAGEHLEIQYVCITAILEGDAKREAIKLLLNFIQQAENLSFDNRFKLFKQLEKRRWDLVQADRAFIMPIAELDSEGGDGCTMMIEKASGTVSHRSVPRRIGESVGQAIQILFRETGGPIGMDDSTLLWQSPSGIRHDFEARSSYTRLSLSAVPHAHDPR